MTTDSRSGNTQYGALPYRIGRDGIEILLITSRERGRWIIPKGWPIAGLTASQAAALEAMEEAGITGTISTDSIGAYGYEKELADHTSRSCEVEVFALEVTEQREAWPEQHQRQREWFDVEQATARVDEPELRVLIREWLKRWRPAATGR